MMPRAKDSEVDLLMQYYPDDQRAGSPFDTGLANALSTDAHPQNSQFNKTHAVINRPTIQAYRRTSGRFRVPRPASYVLEVQG